MALLNSSVVCTPSPSVQPSPNPSRQPSANPSAEPSSIVTAEPSSTTNPMRNSTQPDNSSIPEYTTRPNSESAASVTWTYVGAVGGSSVLLVGVAMIVLCVVRKNRLHKTSEVATTVVVNETCP